jgi:hypothetical protein
LKPKIKVAFASGTDDLNVSLIERMRQIFPELPLERMAGEVNWQLGGGRQGQQAS